MSKTIVEALRELLAAIDAKHDEEPPFKYGVPYAAVNAARAALAEHDAQCPLGCTHECKADVHGCPSECPAPQKRAALSRDAAAPTAEAPTPMTKEWCATFPGTAAWIINELARQIDAAAPAAQPQVAALEYLFLAIVTRADSDYLFRAVNRADEALRAAMPGWTPPVPMTMWAAAPPQTAQPQAVTDDMVNRFLRWYLPSDFAPDGGVSFKPRSAMAPGWPSGTNLLNARQARAMLEYVLAAQPQQERTERERIAELVRSIHSTVSLGHQTGAYAYAGEDFGRYLREATEHCDEILECLAAGPRSPDALPRCPVEPTHWMPLPQAPVELP